MTSGEFLHDWKKFTLFEFSRRESLLMTGKTSLYVVTFGVISIKKEKPWLWFRCSQYSNSCFNLKLSNNMKVSGENFSNLFHKPDDSKVFLLCSQQLKFNSDKMLTEFVFTSVCLFNVQKPDEIFLSNS